MHEGGFYAAFVFALLAFLAVIKGKLICTDEFATA
jgi:hypothetical protein